jgi:quinol monooxygenase YgiN
MRQRKAADQMIQTVMKIMVAPESRAAALELIDAVIERIRVSPGLISYGVYQNILCENSLTILEQWQSKAALNRFICSDEYRIILAIMELAQQSPEIHFFELSKIGGMEIIEKLRTTMTA